MTTATKTAPKLTNGVDVTALFATIEAVKQNTAIAKFNFRLANTWLGGDKNRSTIKQFTGALQEHRTDGKSFVFDNGEAPVLLGEDKAPNPVEWLLHALIGCMTTTTAYHAAARGIAVEAIDSSYRRRSRPARLPRPQRRGPQGLQRHPRAHAREDVRRTRDDQGADRHVAGVRHRFALRPSRRHRRNLLRERKTRWVITTISRTFSPVPSASPGGSRI